ncbi:MAG: hypothetical protein DMD43_10455 [Gemmatimonadetes bacterium]|nr:MAG: hypothetical protein DMD43_10455 [Gemmatimonadota bacterium]
MQFAARDDTGVSGTLTRTGSASGDGRSLTVEVPALAQTGLVHVVGSATAVALQIVPTLRAVGGTVAAGNTLMLEGTGLTEGAVTLTVDGQTVANPDVRTLFDRGQDQQVVPFTAPAGVSAGVVTVQTAGGSHTLRPDSTLSSTTLTPGTDVGDTSATATVVALPLNDRTTIIGQSIGDNAFGGKDVDLYRFTANAGETLTFSATRLGDPVSGNLTLLRLFDAAGTQVASDLTSGPSSTPRIAFFTAPATGTYFLGVSGWANNKTAAATWAAPGATR